MTTPPTNAEWRTLLPSIWKIRRTIKTLTDDTAQRTADLRRHANRGATQHGGTQHGGTP